MPTIKREVVYKTKDRLHGYFVLTDGSRTKFEITHDKYGDYGWYQWGNSTENMGLTVSRVEALMYRWIEEE